ncbi:MAG: hypothetical protein GYB65_05315, partial [Chloroflexi bacterium]|nr:hypothetical protein [Chloroflexota bacterium]
AGPTSDAPMPGEYDLVPNFESSDDALRQAAEGGTPEWQQRIITILNTTGQRTQTWFQGVELDVATLVIVLGLAAVSGLVAAIIDSLLDLPWDRINFTFGWFIAALNGMSYAVIKKKADRAGLLVSMGAGLLAMFFWYILAALVTDDVKLGVDDARNIYRYWLDEYMNLLRAWITGIFVGLIGYGWYVLLDVVPGRLTARVEKLVSGMPRARPRKGKARDDTEQSDVLAEPPSAPPPSESGLGAFAPPASPPPADDPPSSMFG